MAPREAGGASAATGRATTATSDGIDAKDGGAGARFAPLTGSERGAVGASERGAGFGRRERYSLAEFKSLDKAVRGVRKGADDLSVSGSVGGDVEVANLDPNWAIDLPWDGRQHAVDGEYHPDVGPKWWRRRSLR